MKLLPKSASDSNKSKEQIELSAKLAQTRERQLHDAKENLRLMNSNQSLPGDGKQILIIDDEAYNC